MRARISSLVGILLLVPLASAHAQRATLPSPLARAEGSESIGLAVELDRRAAAELARHDAIELVGFPLPDAGPVALELERVPVLTPDATLLVDGEPAERADLGLDVFSAWTGTVAGADGSRAFLAFGERAVWGWVHAGGTLTHVVSEPGPAGWSEPRVRLVGDALLRSIAQPTPYACDLDRAQATAGLPPAPALARASAPPPFDAAEGGALTPLREVQIALESDHQYYQLFGDAGVAASYALAILGASNETYRAQTGVLLTAPHLAVYPSPADPWFEVDFGGDCIDVLYEVQSAFYPNVPGGADVAHLLSGGSLGCGVAFGSTSCVPEYRFSVSGNLHGGVPFPIQQGPLNWDYVVFTHEIGHNLGVPHTHDYCPPLDECAPAGYFGPCQTQEVCTNQGTVMSYCHLCDGNGIANIQPAFHPQIATDIRAYVDDSCHPPFEGVIAKELGGALPGSAGTPELDVGFDAGAHSMTFDLASLPSPESGFLVVGASLLDLPLLGGALVPTLDLLIQFPIGAAAMSLPPADFSNDAFPLGALLWMQVWTTDLASPNLVAASAGEEVELFVPDAPAPLQWAAHPTNGKEYALLSAGTWFRAQSEAEQRGANVVTVSSPSLESWLESTFFDSGLVTSGDVWIGYTDQDSEDDFDWISGATPNHTDWGPGQPDDAGSFEDYASFDGSDWNDLSGFETLQALLERPLTP